MSTIIIGAGPGGYELAALLASKGEQVTLVERDNLGGTCLNRGCIPTKVMAHAAAIVHDIADGPLYGIASTAPAVDMAALAARRADVISQLRQGIEAMMRGVEVIKGEAAFTGPKDVNVDGRTLTADRIVIATGSEPALLPIPGAELAITSDGLLSLERVPASLAIIGGGVIGIEFGAIFAALGSKVTVVEYCKEILPPFDKDIAKRLRMELAKRLSIDFITSAEVTSIESGRVNYSIAAREGSVEAEVVAMAVGRRPVLPQGIELTGVGFDRRGIKVDTDSLETSVPGIYAIGDVNGICMLAHAASAQARRIAREEVNLDVVPSVVFTTPEAAMVGLTEQQCKDRGIDYMSSKALLRGNGKALTMNETSGMVKLIADRSSHRILGCHILAPHAADLIMEPTVAMTSGATIDTLMRTIHPHPTISEALLSALMMLK